MDTILRNAVQSIQVGVEDYLSRDTRRLLSATRNITSGIVLLFKEKLRRLSPPDSAEVLIKQKIEPVIGNAGQVVFRGSGRKTVDVQQIRDRFSALKVSVDWKHFDALAALRNDIEHYFTEQNSASARELLSGAFLLLRDFITAELREEPVALLGNATWGALLNVNAVYEKELSECRQQISRIGWQSETLSQMSAYIRCPRCASELIRPAEALQFFPRITFVCSACGATTRYEQIAQAALDGYFEAVEGISAYEDPDAMALGVCFSCEKETYLDREDFCGRCGLSRPHKNCSVCGDKLRFYEQAFEGLCEEHYTKRPTVSA